MDETQEAVREALKVSKINIFIKELYAHSLCRDLKTTIAAWDVQALKHMCDTLKVYASMINASCLGSRNNYAWYSVQLNVARPQQVSKGKY